MKNKTVPILFIMIFCTTATLEISCLNPSDLPIFTNNVPLDQANAAIVISQTISGTGAAVTAALTTNLGIPLVLKSDQSITVNSQPLVPATPEGAYAQTIATAAEYIIAVNEPTRGIVGAGVLPPPTFDFTSPTAGQAASLSGFTLTWSNPDPNLKVEITLKQTIDNVEKSHKFGPLADTGTQTFSVADLADFRSGKNLTLSVTLTKIREQANLPGFKSGTAATKLSTTELVTPGP